MLWALDMVVQRRVGAKVLDFDRSRVSSTVRAADTAAAAPTQSS